MTAIDGVMLPFSAYSLMTLYISTGFQENILKFVKVIEQTHIENYEGA